ncbi:hypothetical protein RB653_001495 [Dictyostelium firmibasis]|uniref:Tyrosine specific protein phosphatases domain-containing protein n=1 Tax=Dictyostelium firmibasis TaxID=79012 RepID=A0AAN7TYM7_9MYCE
MNRLLNLMIIILSISVILIKGDYLEYRKVHLVDQTTPLGNGNINYLFRGNEPKELINGTEYFAYEELINCMVNNSLSAGVKLPPQFIIVDIKLIYGLIDEESDIELEQTFFNANPQYGEFGTNVTLGDLWDPNFLPERDVKNWALNLSDWQHDNLPHRIPFYHDLLYTQHDLPLILYIHCECGCDRTGEVFASYAMKYLDYSFKESMEWDYKIAGRRIMINHQFASQWYCYYLQVAEGMTIDCSPPPLLE